MKKLKNNFFHIIPLHYPKFYNCFLPCFAQGRHFFVIPSDQHGRRKVILSVGGIKKGFTELPFHIAIVSNCINLVMTEKKLLLPIRVQNLHFRPKSQVKIKN